ncbi:fumarylacetoacetate hydrolase family protein [Mesorhizobium sp. M3A.F.Ca.ET.201.01.1.1]|uniref:fumarylacetoacetate hydrolase family protein n=1 Tax=Mesorhizobium sp. M3A.F.Ca.ET.201.01.1.1 TaxID=2563946 RepID=UPI002484C556|nr:fumarylacetoacetate hydrolase family protein [Mesorhizobium sp. M3A.F.Ca.ET.201.01.1.1]
MIDFVLPPPAMVSVAVAGSAERFAVRRIFCVGRNYAAHARESGNDERDPPFSFTKPADAVVDSGVEIPYPPVTGGVDGIGKIEMTIGQPKR